MQKSNRSLPLAKICVRPRQPLLPSFLFSFMRSVGGDSRPLFPSHFPLRRGKSGSLSPLSDLLFSRHRPNAPFPPLFPFLYRTDREPLPFSFFSLMEMIEALGAAVFSLDLDVSSDLFLFPFPLFLDPRPRHSLFSPPLAWLPL